jgi:ABC-type polysaccharide/polyol phosphate transport system ATPase subunit
MTLALQARGISKRYAAALRGHAQRQALQPLDLDLHRGEGIALLGPNGAGKSTLLRVLGGIFAPSTGWVATVGQPEMVLELGSWKLGEFTGWEHAELAWALKGLPMKQRPRAMEELAEFTGLGPVIHEPLRTYSAGMALRLSFAIATWRRPEVLLIDETISVGDDEFRSRCNERLRSFVAQGSGLIFATHDLGLARQWCGRCYHLNAGQAVEGRL